jgi:hypothetical protein
MSKHLVDEPNWLVPVPDTWARIAKLDAPVLAVNGEIDSSDHIGMAERLAATVTPATPSPSTAPRITRTRNAPANTAQSSECS